MTTYTLLVTEGTNHTSEQFKDIDKALLAYKKVLDSENLQVVSVDLYSDELKGSKFTHLKIA